MRTIKFRGKSIESGEWLYGSLYNDGAEDYILENLPNSALDFEERQIDQNTLSQFTGLQDARGKDIYEGDIVECVSWNEYFSKDGQPMEPFGRKMYVDFRRGGFKMVEPMHEPMKDNEWDIICNGDIVIIGNVFDNSELLKGGEQ